MNIETSTNKVVADSPSGLMSFISWKRLAEEVFARSGELQPGERVTHFDITERGIAFRIGEIPE